MPCHDLHDLTLGVDVFCIDAEELIGHGIRYDSVSMQELNASYNISNPGADKVRAYPIYRAS